MREDNTEVTLKLGPGEQYDFDGVGKGRKTCLAVEAVYAKAQRHEKSGNWSIWLVRQEARLGK